MEFHEVVSLFPRMADEEYKDLVQSVREKGLLEPIWTYQGKIVDGRHRYRACQEAGVSPRFREWDGNGSLVTFVVTLNLKRRHLNQSQKAAIAADMLPMLEAEAKKRQIALAGSRGTAVVDDLSQKIDQGGGRATEHAATIVGTNRQYVSDFKAIAQKAPDLADRVRNGETNLSQAVRQLKQRELREQARVIDEAPPPLPTGRFRVIEADPPWGLEANEGKSGGHQYPTMTTDELCAMGAEVLERAEGDCHLYLWAINPMLPEAFRVMEAWGFTYKTTITWVKTDGIGTGHYYRGTTEHVLFGVRGKLDTLHKDQPTHFEAPRSRHSAKPDEFYGIVERMSMGPRMRLFARSQRPGWVSWGDQA